MFLKKNGTNLFSSFFSLVSPALHIMVFCNSKPRELGLIIYVIFFSFFVSRENESCFKIGESFRALSRALSSDSLNLKSYVLFPHSSRKENSFSPENQGRDGFFKCPSRIGNPIKLIGGRD